MNDFIMRFSNKDMLRTENNLCTSLYPLRFYEDISNSSQQLLDMDRNILQASCCGQYQQLYVAREFPKLYGLLWLNTFQTSHSS